MPELPIEETQWTEFRRRVVLPGVIMADRYWTSGPYVLQIVGGQVFVDLWAQHPDGLWFLQGGGASRNYHKLHPIPEYTLGIGNLKFASITTPMFTTADRRVRIGITSPDPLAFGSKFLFALQLKQNEGTFMLVMGGRLGASGTGTGSTGNTGGNTQPPDPGETVAGVDWHTAREDMVANGTFYRRLGGINGHTFAMDKGQGTHRCNLWKYIESSVAGAKVVTKRLALPSDFGEIDYDARDYVPANPPSTV